MVIQPYAPSSSPVRIRAPLKATGYSRMVLATSARTWSAAELFCSLRRTQRSGHIPSYISTTHGTQGNSLFFSQFHMLYFFYNK